MCHTCTNLYTNFSDFSFHSRCLYQSRVNFFKVHFLVNCGLFFIADWYVEAMLANEEYKGPGYEERKRRIGCTFACILKQENYVSFFVLWLMLHV